MRIWRRRLLRRPALNRQPSVGFRRNLILNHSTYQRRRQSQRSERFVVDRVHCIDFWIGAMPVRSCVFGLRGNLQSKVRIVILARRDRGFFSVGHLEPALRSLQAGVCDGQRVFRTIVQLHSHRQRLSRRHCRKRVCFIRNVSSRSLGGSHVCLKRDIHGQIHCASSLLLFFL